MKILVADDDEIFRQLVHDLLVDAGYTVITAENGLLAWEEIEKEKPDMLVTDVNMPQMTGFELVNKIRQDTRFWRMPILMLTIREMTEDQVQGYEYGADDYLIKPFEVDIFLARVKVLERRILDRK